MNAEKNENRQNRWADFKGRRNKTPWDLEWVQVSRLGICLGPTSGIDIRANKNPGHDNLNRKPLEGLDSLSRNYSQITLTIQFELVDSHQPCDYEYTRTVSKLLVINTRLQFT